MEITKQDRNRKVKEYEYGQIEGFNLSYLDIPVKAEFYYNDANELIYENYDNLISFIENNLIPHYINKSVLVLESDDAIKMYDELSKNYIVYNDSIEMRNSYMSLLNIARVMIGIFFGLSLLCSFFLFYIKYVIFRIHT